MPTKTTEPKKEMPELHFITLKGKQYLPVQQRVLWFRYEHSDWTLDTEIVDRTERSATVRAYVKDETGRLISTSLKTETAVGFPDFLEKAETGSIGRALALCGYGTQFAAELDEGDDVVDAPVGHDTPASSTPDVPASDKQLGLIKTLVNQKGVTSISEATGVTVADPANLTKAEASHIIERLIALKAPQQVSVDEAMADTIPDEELQDIHF